MQSTGVTYFLIKSARKFANNIYHFIHITSYRNYSNKKRNTKSKLRNPKTECKIHDNTKKHRYTHNSQFPRPRTKKNTKQTFTNSNYNDQSSLSIWWCYIMMCDQQTKEQRIENDLQPEAFSVRLRYHRLRQCSLHAIREASILFRLVPRPHRKCTPATPQPFTDHTLIYTHILVQQQNQQNTNTQWAIFQTFNSRTYFLLKLTTWPSYAWYEKSLFHIAIQETTLKEFLYIASYRFLYLYICICIFVRRLSRCRDTAFENGSLERPQKSSS